MLTQRPDSKLVIYGLSGLANSQDDPEQTTPITTPIIITTTVPTSHAFVGVGGVNKQQLLLQHESSPSQETSSSDVFVQSSSDMQDSLEMTGTLHVIQEETLAGRRKGGDKNEFGTGSGTHATTRGGMGMSQDSLSRRDEFGRNSVKGSLSSVVAENVSSSRQDGRKSSYEGSGYEENEREGRKSSYAGEGIPGENNRRESRKDSRGTRYVENRGDGRLNGYGGEEFGENRREGTRMNGFGRIGDSYNHQWKAPVQGSVADVEHKSVSSLLQQRQQENTPLSNHTPRTYSESELARESRWDYDAECQTSHAHHERGPSHGAAKSPQHYGSHRDKLISSSYSHLHPPSPQHPQDPPISPPPPHQSSSSYRHATNGYPHRPSSAPYRPSSSVGLGGSSQHRPPSRGGSSPHRPSSGVLSPHRPSSSGAPTPQDMPPYGYRHTPRDTPPHRYGHTPQDTHPHGYTPTQRDTPTHVPHPYEYEYGSSSRGPSPLVTSPHEYGPPQHRYPSPHHRNSETTKYPSPQHYPQALPDNSNPHHQEKLQQYSHSQSNPSLKYHQFRGDEPPPPKPSYNQWQRNSGVTRGDARSSLRAYRYQHSNSRDTVASENLEWDHRQGQQRSPASAGVVGEKHFKTPAYVGAAGGQRNSQAWKAGHHAATTNGTWNDDEDNSSRVSSSLPADSKADFSLYEEDEIEGSEVAASSTRRMSAPAHDVQDSMRHVSRHKRLRHSTITSLTSLPDISGVCEGYIS